MGIKCIAIGNRIMKDDGIGIKVLEDISSKLAKENLDIIVGETDVDYTLGKVDDGDTLFILDATYFDRVPGTVTFVPIEENSQDVQIYSQHQQSFIHSLKAYKKSIAGYIIGIEVAEIDFDVGLSQTLSEKFSSICDEVYQFIISCSRRITMHDTFLLNKISDSLPKICRENKISKIEKMTLAVHYNSHINEENLLEHLKRHNSDIIASKLVITVHRKGIEEQTAIIEGIGGETIARG